jgi:hypothetical protein
VIQNHFFLGVNFLGAALVFGAFAAFGAFVFLVAGDFLTILLVFPAVLAAAFLGAFLTCLAGDLAGDEVVATGAVTGVVVVAGVVTAGAEVATLGDLGFLTTFGLEALVAF